jgi:hypothetical protein
MTHFECIRKHPQGREGLGRARFHSRCAFRWKSDLAGDEIVFRKAGRTTGEGAEP